MGVGGGETCGRTCGGHAGGHAGTHPVQQARRRKRTQTDAPPSTHPHPTRLRRLHARERRARWRPAARAGADGGRLSARGPPVARPAGLPWLAEGGVPGSPREACREAGPAQGDEVPPAQYRTARCRWNGPAGQGLDSGSRIGTRSPSRNGSESHRVRVATGPGPNRNESEPELLRRFERMLAARVGNCNSCNHYIT